MLRFRHLLLALLGLGAASTVSCTAIFAPRDDVQRCGTADDCDPTGDNRYVAECRYDPGNLDLDTTQVDKICVAAFNVPSCDPRNFMGDLAAEWQRLEDGARYNPMGMSCPELGGVRGCPADPMTGLCADGLTLNDQNICDVEGGNAFNVAFPPEGVEDIGGQDVLDQLCGAFFCDAQFVCDQSDYKCRKCDPDKPFGQGGCGQVFISGAPSCVYADVDEVCEAPESEIAASGLGC